MVWADFVQSSVDCFLSISRIALKELTSVKHCKQTAVYEEEEVLLFEKCGKVYQSKRLNVPVNNF